MRCGFEGDSNENKPAVGAEEEEVAKMGCPSLGEHTQVEVVIEESYEFKVIFHWILYILLRQLLLLLILLLLLLQVIVVVAAQ